MTGGEGDDTIDGGDGDDDISGGANDDLITGGQGEDTLSGDGGADDFRYVEVSDSQGLLNDIITDFESGTDRIVVEENVLVQAGGGATSVAPVAGINAPSFGQAAGAISMTAFDGVADWVFQELDGGDPATLWIDTNDDGLLTGLDLQIELTGVSALVAGDVILVDTIAPADPTIFSVSDDTADVDTANSTATGTTSDFITNDDGTDTSDPVVRINLDVTATDGTAAQADDQLETTGLPTDLATNSTMGAGAVAYTADYELTAADITAGFVEITLNDGGGLVDDEELTITAQVVDDTTTDIDGNPAADATSGVASQLVNIDTTATITVESVTGDNTTDGTGDFINASEVGAVVTTGSVTDVEDGQEVVVTYTDTLANSVTTTAVVGATTTGNFETAGEDLSGLAEGAITINVSVQDKAGNIATDSPDATVTKDTLAGITITTPIAGDDVVDDTEDTAVDVAGAVTTLKQGPPSA